MDLVVRKVRKNVWEQDRGGLFRNVYKMVRTLSCPAWLELVGCGESDPGGNKKGLNTQNAAMVKRKRRK